MEWIQVEVVVDTGSWIQVEVADTIEETVLKSIHAVSCRVEVVRCSVEENNVMR